MRKRLPVVTIALLTFLLAAIVFGSIAYAFRPPLIPCFPKNIYCLDVWDPVICSNGVVYSNDCYARRACATGCVPWGGQTQ